MYDQILWNARLNDGKTAGAKDQLSDVFIKDGKIAKVALAMSRVDTDSAADVWDLDGRVLLPGLIDAHTHLDKTYTTLENRSGTLGEAIDVWQRVRVTRSKPEIIESAERAIRTAIANGVTTLRSHIDIGSSHELLPVVALLELREKYSDQIDLQFVALGTAADRPEWRIGLERSLEMGVDLVGSAPALCHDYRQEIDAVFEVALKHNKGIDLHIDETEDLNMLSLEYLAEQTIRYGMQGRVTAGHCCSLAFVRPEVAQRVIEKVAAAEISIVTLPSCNLVLMGRSLRPAPRGTTPVKELLEAGVNVCAASDNVHDPFNPFGSYDLLQIANLNAHLAHMTGLDELYTSLDMVTGRAANCNGFDARTPDQITVGQAADLVVLDCRRVLDAVLAPPMRLGTFKRGKLIVQTQIDRRWRSAEHATSTNDIQQDKETD